MLQNRHPRQLGGKRVALLVSEEHGAGVSTLVERTGSKTVTLRVFSSYARAASWLAGNDI